MSHSVSVQHVPFGMSINKGLFCLIRCTPGGCSSLNTEPRCFIHGRKRIESQTTWFLVTKEIKSSQRTFIGCLFTLWNQRRNEVVGAVNFKTSSGSQRYDASCSNNPNYCHNEPLLLPPPPPPLCICLWSLMQDCWPEHRLFLDEAAGKTSQPIRQDGLGRDGCVCVCV